MALCKYGCGRRVDRIPEKLDEYVHLDEQHLYIYTQITSIGGFMTPTTVAITGVYSRCSPFTPP